MPVDLSTVFHEKKKILPPLSLPTTEEKKVFLLIEELVAQGVNFLGSHWTAGQYYELIVVMRNGEKRIFKSLLPFPKSSYKDDDGNTVFV